MNDSIGHVIGVNGSQATCELSEATPHTDALTRASRIGALARIKTTSSTVFGVVSAIHVEKHAGQRSRVAVIDLIGEKPDPAEPGGRTTFLRGVSFFPNLGDPMLVSEADDFAEVYAVPSRYNVRIGTIYQDPAVPAYLMTDDLLAKHFLVVGSTGSGKSCSAALVLRAMLDAHKNAHVIMLDPHNEYASAFGDLAEVVNIDNLELPCWLLDYEESVQVLVRGGSPQEQESQAAILKEAIVAARRKYAGDGPQAQWITVDTPVPYRVGDLIRIIDNALGKLDKADTSAPYLRLKGRLESLNSDKRFSFMFSGVFVKDNLPQVVSRMLRIPVKGKPMTIVDLSGVPSEVVDVVVSLLCRMTFDFALWSDRTKTPPILLVAEEAHRYIPADEKAGFASTRGAIARIAKEGRKYGVSLGLITQRPSELSPSILSQCGTLFALRMGNEADNRFVANALPENARGMLNVLPALRRQEAVVVGEGVTAPMRIRFNDLPEEHRPRSASAVFSKAWQEDRQGQAFVEESIQRWRMQVRYTGPSSPAPEPVGGAGVKPLAI